MNHMDLENPTTCDTQPAVASQTEQAETTPTGVPTESVTAMTPTEILPPSGTLGTSGDFSFVETDYEPHPDVTPDEVAKLPNNDLLTGLKKQYRRTRQEIEVYLVYFEEAVRRFGVEQPRSDGGQFERKDKPLTKAFDAIGRHYETERKRAWRYRNALKTRVRLPGSVRPRWNEWDFVEDANSGEQIVVGTPKVGHVEIVPIGGNLEDAKVVSTRSLSRVPVKAIALNQLILCDDNGKRYRYVGNGILKCVEVPKLVKQVQDRGAAAIKARQEQLQATAEDKTHHKVLRSAEACRNDLDLITEKPDKTKTKSQLDTEVKQKAAKPKVARTQKPAKLDKTKSKFQLEAEAKKAEEKAKQEIEDKARRAKNDAATGAVIASIAPYGTDEYGKPEFLGKQDAEAEQIVH